MESLKELVEEIGFSNITLTGLAQKAKVEPHVLYNRFGDLNTILDKFAEYYDYWLNEILDYNLDEVSDVNKEMLLTKMLSGLVESLYNNESMRQILIWEVSESNPTTTKLAHKRDIATEPFLKFYRDIFKDVRANKRLGAVEALLVGGIYYLTLRKDRSPFCGVSFNTQEGKEELLQGVSTFCSLLFSLIHPKDEVIQIARKMKNKGIDKVTISDCTGLTDEQLSTLI